MASHLHVIHKIELSKKNSIILEKSSSAELTNFVLVEQHLTVFLPHRPYIYTSYKHTDSTVNTEKAVWHDQTKYIIWHGNTDRILARAIWHHQAAACLQLLFLYSPDPKLLPDPSVWQFWCYYWSVISPATAATQLPFFFSHHLCY